MIVIKSSPTLCNLKDCSLRVSSVHGMFQARKLEWVAVSYSKGSSQCKEWTCVSCFFTTVPPGKPLICLWLFKVKNPNFRILWGPGQKGQKEQECTFIHLQQPTYCTYWSCAECHVMLWVHKQVRQTLNLGVGVCGTHTCTMTKAPL